MEVSGQHLKFVTPVKNFRGTNSLGACAKPGGDLEVMG